MSERDEQATQDQKLSEAEDFNAAPKTDDESPDVEGHLRKPVEVAKRSNRKRSNR
jgi:hypothetical protein